MNTKSFKEYLLESKQTYEFKIKIAGNIEESASTAIKQSLQKYNVESISDVRRTPIQENVVDFPEHNNMEVNIMDIVLTYPITSTQLRNIIAETLNKTQSCVIVRNLKEQEEEKINSQYNQNEKSGEATLSKPYDKENHQALVGNDKVMSLLKELSKDKNQGTQYKGVNDKILASKSPSSKKVTSEAPKKSLSAVGSTTIKKPDPYKGN